MRRKRAKRAGTPALIVVETKGREGARKRIKRTKRSGRSRAARAAPPASRAQTRARAPLTLAGRETVRRKRSQRRTLSQKQAVAANQRKRRNFPSQWIRLPVPESVPLLLLRKDQPAAMGEVEEKERIILVATSRGPEAGLESGRGRGPPHLSQLKSTSGGLPEMSTEIIFRKFSQPLARLRRLTLGASDKGPG